jgi:hypothetical protein
VVKEVRIYVEGGGDQADGKRLLRIGFSQFFKNALSKNVKVIPCGGRDQAFDNFKIALKDHATALNLLLVDAEAAVDGMDDPWTHLQKRDRWQRPSAVKVDQCHLMVQTMEAWFLADKQALQQFYEKGFNANALSRNQNVEEIAKAQLELSLIAATKLTSKGEYHKINHASELLKIIDPAKVRKASPHFDRLMNKLREYLK